MKDLLLKARCPYCGGTVIESIDDSNPDAIFVRSVLCQKSGTNLTYGEIERSWRFAGHNHTQNATETKQG